MNVAVTTGIASAIGHDPPFSSADLATVTQLAVVHARDLTGLDELVGLEMLQLVGCDLEDLSGLRLCRNMTLLDVVASRLGDISVLRTLRQLRQVSIRCADVVDLSPLLQLESLVVVGAIGCPLDEMSYRDVAENLRTSDVRVDLSDEECWELTCALWSAAIPASFHDSEGTHRLCAPGLDITDTPEAGQPAITPDDLRAELAAGTTLVELYEKYAPTFAPPPERKEWNPLHLRERGTADDARRWLVGSELRDDIHQTLLRFVDDFPTVDYLRETDELFTEIEERDRVSLPDWLKEIRGVISAPFHESGVCHLELPVFPGIDAELSGEFGVYEIRGPADDAERRQTIELSQVYPVASGGSGGMYVLTAKLDEPDNYALYHFHVSDLSERSDGVYASGALRHYIELFDLATAVTLQDGTRILRRNRNTDTVGPGPTPETDPGTGASRSDDGPTDDTGDGHDEPADDPGDQSTDGPGMRLLSALTGMPASELATAEGFERGMGGLASSLGALASARVSSDASARRDAASRIRGLGDLLRDHGIEAPIVDSQDDGEPSGSTEFRPSVGPPVDPGEKLRGRLNDVLTGLVDGLEGLRDDLSRQGDHTSRSADGDQPASG